MSWLGCEVYLLPTMARCCDVCGVVNVSRTLEGQATHHFFFCLNNSIFLLFLIVFESFRGFGKATFLLSRCCAMSQSQENGEMDYSVRLPSSKNLLSISIKQGRVFLFRSTLILRIGWFYGLFPTAWLLSWPKELAMNGGFQAPLGMLMMSSFKHWPKLNDLNVGHRFHVLSGFSSNMFQYYLEPSFVPWGDD